MTRYRGAVRHHLRGSGARDASCHERARLPRLHGQSHRQQVQQRRGSGRAVVARFLFSVRAPQNES